MKSNTQITETIIANALEAILERLDALEKATDLISGQCLALLQKPPVGSLPTVQQAVLLQKLDQLTLKRHAVLSATLGGQSYKAIAEAMQCDQTTVKLHLKAVLEIMGMRSRSALMATKPDLLEFVSDEEYEHRYGVDKRWWLTEKPELMAVLRQIKPAKNQHTPKQAD